VNLNAEIERLIIEMKKPRLLCICGHFKCVEADGFDFYRCGNCNGWMSKLRLIEAEHADKDNK
jgi:Zn finger protein HypA/HybF involved in hydrogenase expression